MNNDYICSKCLKVFSAVGGVDTHLLNFLEMEILSTFDYKLYISEDTFK